MDFTLSLSFCRNWEPWQPSNIACTRRRSLDREAPLVMHDVGPTNVGPGGRRITVMSIDELEAEALKLAPAARARLAERLLESLETLSDEENARLWADEAQRRDEAWDASGKVGHAADDVFREARARLK